VTRNFTLTLDAADDTLAIWEFIAADESERIADKVIARIYDECEKLGATPGIGHFREDLISKDFKFWRVWSYLIVYRWQATPIQVIAVVHGARNLSAFLRRRG